MVTASQNQPLQKEKTLDSTIRFDIGSLEITGEKSSGFPLFLRFGIRQGQFCTQTCATTPLLTGRKAGFFSDLRALTKQEIHAQRLNNRLRLALSDSIPLKLQINAGVGDARLSLSGLKISNLDFESGVGEARVSAYEPNSIPCEHIKLKNGVGRLEATGLGNLNFRELEFDGGVGGATLDFTGEWKQNADIRIQVGVGGVNVRIPREIGVKVESAKNFLSGLHLEGFNKQDSFYYSENYDKAAIRVSIYIATGIGGLRITWI